jgi:hypothetical protein
VIEGCLVTLSHLSNPSLPWDNIVHNWEDTKRYSKIGFDRAWEALDKLGPPVNRLSARLGAEIFWPISVDKESDKAARIVRSFCKDGFYAPESEDARDENGEINRPKGKPRISKKITQQVINNAKALAIFTTMRTGLWLSGAGSGVFLGLPTWLPRVLRRELTSSGSCYVFVSTRPMKF